MQMVAWGFLILQALIVIASLLGYGIFTARPDLLMQVDPQARFFTWAFHGFAIGNVPNCGVVQSGRFPAVESADGQAAELQLGDDRLADPSGRTDNEHGIAVVHGIISVMKRGNNQPIPVWLEAAGLVPRGT